MVEAYGEEAPKLINDMYSIAAKMIDYLGLDQKKYTPYILASLYVEFVDVSKFAAEFGDQL